MVEGRGEEERQIGDLLDVTKLQNLKDGMLTDVTHMFSVCF
jgi:hypothetical protein